MWAISPDVDLFRLLPSSPHKEVSDAEIDAWRNASLPTFNRQVVFFFTPLPRCSTSIPHSLAIESQLANLHPSDVSENTFVLSFTFSLYLHY